MARMTTTEVDKIIREKRNAAIVMMHDNDNLLFTEIGNFYGITKQRAHQIYKATLRKQRKA